MISTPLSRVAGQDGAADEVSDRGPHAGGGQRPCGEGRDGTSGGVGRDREGVVDVPAGVHDLEEDLARLGPVHTARGGRGDPHGVDGVGDHSMHVALCRRRQLTHKRPDLARPVELLRWPRTFFIAWVCRLNLLDVAK